MFEDENQSNNNSKDKSYLSGKEAITSNSAVKAAIFVFVLMACIVLIYSFAIKKDDGGPKNTVSPTGGTSAPGTVTTPGPTDTVSQGVNTTPSPAITEQPFSYKRGDENPKIQEIQTLLKQKKYLADDVALSNTFGPATEAAVKLFQKENGLTETGIVDNELFRKIQQAAVRDTSFPLQLKSDNEKVKELQTILAEKKYLVFAAGDSPTTYFGPLTEEAVKKFQKQNGLPETGIVTATLFEQIKNAPALS